MSESPRQRRTRRLRRPGARAAATAVAGLVVLLAVSALCGGLLLLLHHSVTSSLDDAAAQRVSRTVDDLTSGAVPGELSPDSLQRSYGADIVQVVDATTGQVVAGAEGAPLVTPAEHLPASGARSDMEHQGSEYRVSWNTAEVDGQRYLVMAGADDESTDRLVHTVALLLALAVPVIAVVAAVVTWVLVGRALAPVTRIVGEAREISAADLTRRVSVPEPDDEVRAVAVAVNSMLDRIEDGRRVQTEFVGDASHELRSPLATLSAVLELAGRDGAGLTPGQVRNIAAPEVRRLSALVEDLLYLARTDEGTTTMTGEDVDLDDVVQGEISRLRAVAPHLAVSGAVQPVRVTGDLRSLGRAVRNLTDNALHHAVNRVHVSVTGVAGRTGPGDAAAWTARLTVDDDGPGIPTADRERIFGRFVRLDAARTRPGSGAPDGTGGTGLGLPITAQIAAAHGGRVRVEQAPPPLSGAQFVLELPAQEPPVSR